MKIATKVCIVAAFVGMSVVAFKPLFTKSNDRDRLIMSLVDNALKAAHYSELKFDDSFSSCIFDEYIMKLDYSKRFFLKSDIQKLEKYRYSIDDMLLTYNLELCDVATEIIRRRQLEAEKYYNEAIESDFDFSKDEWIETNPDSLQFAETQEELRDLWRKITKFAVLEKYYNLIKIQEKAVNDNDTTYKQKTMDEMKAESVKRVKESYDEWMKRINNLKDKDWTSLFFNAIIATCDPHSEYMPPEEKTNFDISMSGKFEGIGATLQNKNSQTKVVDIIPGSASWRQGELEVNDIIVMVGQGDEAPVDITPMPLDEAIKLIRGKKGTTVKLTVKKIDGTIKVIPIVRDVVIIEETYAKSSVLTMPNGERIGYLYLPKFYADFQDRNGRFCAKDVKTEIAKLSAENVEGIIFDLRNNGGGSLSDVVDMSGLFITNGPIVQVRTREDNVRQLEDKDPAIDYNGPVVVMINSFSASASEILAAALQDYDRAIIMGSPSSFGKGTVQTIYDFDRMINGYSNMKPLGAMRLTIQKFYRINGGTTQLKGVIPDIIVPDNYSYMEVGEKEQRHALPYDVIKKGVYTPWRHSYNTKKVVEASRKRVENNQTFNQIEENAKRLKKRSDESYFSLNLDTYKAYQNEVENEVEKYSKIGKDKTGLKAGFIGVDKQSTEVDTVKTQRFTKWFDELEKDVYLLEAANVIHDMAVKSK